LRSLKTFVKRSAICDVKAVRLVTRDRYQRLCIALATAMLASATTIVASNAARRIMANPCLAIAIAVE
jgi:hypothetical protein